MLIISNSQDFSIPGTVAIIISRHFKMLQKADMIV